MKKFFILSFVFLAISFNTFAFPIGFQAAMNGNRTYTEARIYNHTNRVLVCSGTAYAYTFGGHAMNAWMNNARIFPGQYAYVYFYTNFYNQFHSVSGYANCLAY